MGTKVPFISPLPPTHARAYTLTPQKSKSRKRKDKVEAELQRVEAMQAAVLPALATLLTRVQSEPFAVWVVRMLAKFDPSTLTARQCTDLVKACKKLPAMMFMKTDNEFFSAVAEVGLVWEVWGGGMSFCHQRL